MKSIPSFVLVTTLSAFASFSVAARFARPEPRLPRSEACWVFETEDLKEEARYADAVVVAEAVAIHPGRTVHSDDGQDALPFEVVEFRVQEGLKGVASGDSVHVERAGGIGADGVELEVDADGGEYGVGRRYLLFLKLQPETGFHYLVNDQGRYELARDGHVTFGARPGPIATELDGRPVADVLERVRSALE